MRTATSLTLLLTTVALAGCTGPAEPELTLTAVGVPTSAIVGQATTFALEVTGDSLTTDHVGAHFWSEPTTDPDGDFGMAGGCAHSGLTVPGSVSVACTFPTAGTYYLRGHVRTADGTTTWNHWTAPYTIEVGAPLTLTAMDVPSSAVAGDAFSFELSVIGDAPSSDHIGGHFWLGDVSDPTAEFSQAVGGCAHTSGDIPSTYEVECTIEEAGTYTLYGHVRTTSGSAQWEHWSGAHTIVVS